MASKKDITEIFLHWRDYLASVVSRIVPPNDIEDIVQETYVRACQYIDAEEIRSPKAFMTRIAHNLALDHIKRADLRLVTNIGDLQDDKSEFISSPAVDPDIQAASREEFALFCEAVRELPLQCRRVFVLKKVYGYSQQEIAASLDINENTVEKHVALGIKRCVLFMKQHASETKADDAGIHGANSRDGAG